MAGMVICSYAISQQFIVLFILNDNFMDRIILTNEKIKQILDDVN